MIENARIAEIEAMPPDMRADALLDWRTVAALLNLKDIDTARATVINAGVPLVHLNSRRRLPRWGTFRDFLKAREKAAA